MVVWCPRRMCKVRIDDDSPPFDCGSTANHSLTLWPGQQLRQANFSMPYNLDSRSEAILAILCEPRSGLLFFSRRA